MGVEVAEATQILQPYERFLTRSPSEVARELESFATLLVKWNRAQNLVSRETLPHLWTRHIADSLQLLPLMGLEARTVLDLGSGGGLPAVPLAIATAGRATFILTEPVSKKASFLKAVSRELGLNLTVEAQRAEALQEVPAPDVVTSRALAALPDLLDLAEHFFAQHTRGLFLKGREHVDEVAETRARWRFDVVIHPSRTETGAAVLEISNLSRR